MTQCGFVSRSLLAGCLLALGTLPPQPARCDAPPPRPQKVVTVEGITEYRLDNGVRILLFPDSSTSKVTVNATVFVGSRHEGYGETGMAHLLEHMVFKGTPAHRNIPKALRDRGANFNGTTWYDRTNYFETLDATGDNLEFAIRFEADRLVNSFIKREDLASEMTVVRNEFEMGENDPQNILSQRMLAVAYEWHNYGKATIGNRSDIERVPIDRLQAFYRKYYQPDNVMVIVAGNFKEDKALAYLARYFGALPKPQRRLEETYTEEPPQDGERRVVLRRAGTVGVVGAVYHVPAGAHEDFAAVEVLANLLAAEPSGRLYQGLVKTRKASRVSSVAYGLHDPGVLEILVQVDKDKPLDAVRDTLLELLDRVRTGGVTAGEVERAQRKLLTDRELLMSNSNRIGIVLSEWAAKGDWRLFFLHRDRVARVTPADVNRVARLYLQPVNRTVGLYVPTRQAERASIPATPDVARLLKDYKGGQAVAQGEFFDPTPANIEKRVRRPALGGGVKTALLPRKTRGAMVTAELTLRYGNADSLKGNTSATQLLAPLMARGTNKHNRQELRDELDRLRARVVPSGVLGQLTFTIHCKRANFPAVLALVREMLRAPTFPAEEFDVLKRQTRDALQKNRTDPAPLAVRTLQGKLNPYPPDDVRYVPAVEESIQRLEAVTLDQVRTLYATQVGGQAGEFVAVGDFDPATTLRLVEDMLKDWKAAVHYRHIDRSARPGVKGETVVIHTPDKANAFYFAGLAMPLNDSDPDNPALEVANFLFGGGPLSSRLANRVRQKEGLSYGVASQYGADSRDRMARFTLFALCNPANMDKVDRAIREELTRLLKEGVGATELDEAKKAYLAKLKAGRSSDDQLVRLLQDGLYASRTFAYWADLEQKVAALTPAEVTAAFRKHIDPAKLVIIHAGDLKKPAGGSRQ